MRREAIKKGGIVKKRLSIFLVLSAMALALSACGGGGGGGGGGTTTALKGLAACGPVAGEGVICGTALAPDGKTPIVGAEVKEVAAAAETIALKGLTEDGIGKQVASDTGCFTDVNGVFACGGITTAGNLSFQITGGGFTISFTATVVLGGVTNVPAASTTAAKGSGTFKYAVVLGAFDSIQDILASILGCGTLTNGALQVGTECQQIELIDASGTNPNTALSTVLGLSPGTYPTLADFLKNAKTAEALAMFKGIFFNCGMDESLIDDPVAQAALQAYVNAGGNLYASDWAYLYIQKNWNSAINWEGGNSADLARVGGSNNTQPVNVVGSGLLTWLRSQGLIGASDTTFNVDFNLGGWVVMTGTGSGTNELLSADSLPNGPADVPVAPATTLPITVDFPSGSGCVFYTSYHNEPEGVVGGNAVQSRVLEYLTLNRFGNCK